jgi:hypothetical protein
MIFTKKPVPSISIIIGFICVVRVLLNLEKETLEVQASQIRILQSKSGKNKNKKELIKI